jgi:hypothetical protein
LLLARAATDLARSGHERASSTPTSVAANPAIWTGGSVFAQQLDRDVGVTVDRRDKTCDVDLLGESVLHGDQI